MPLLTIECEKEQRSGSYAASWRSTKKKKHPDFTWEKRRDAQVHKADCASWSHIVKQQYAPARRSLRVYRWYRRSDARDTVENLFRMYVGQWKRDTQHWSSVTKMLAHRSYLDIVGLSKVAKPKQLERLLLEEMQAEPDYWFDALEVITRANPVQDRADFDQAVSAWIQWGRDNGILARENH